MKRSTKENICVTIIVFIVLLIIAYTFINNKLNNKVSNKVSNKEYIDSTVNLVEIDSEFVDEDDYNQADWKSYTPVSDSIE